MKNVWLYVDPLTSAVDALHAAVELARRTGAELTLVGAIGRSEDRIFRTSFGEHILRLVRKDREARVLSLEADARRALPDGRVRSMVLEGEVPWHTVAVHAGELRPDLLVVAARSGAGAGFDPPSQHLFRKCAAPVWAVHPRAPTFPRRLLAAVEPGAHGSGERLLAGRVLEVARQLAGGGPLELHVVHAWTVPGEEALRPSIGEEGLRTLADGVRDRARRELDELLADAAIAGGAEVHLARGEPAEVVAAVAERLDADLVVLGSVGPSGLAGHFIGGTAEAILARLARSALVVKPPGFVSPVLASPDERPAEGAAR